MAAAAVLGVASTAARISTLRALLVAAGSFGVVVELGAFVLEAPRAVVGLEVDSVGLLLVQPGRGVADGQRMWCSNEAPRPRLI